MSLGLVGAALDPPSGVGSACVILGASEPSAVLRRVALCGVSPVELMIHAGAFAHVFEEVLEGFPSRTNSDPASSVVFVRGVSGVLAPAVHGGPCLVGRSARPAVLVRRHLFSGVAGQSGASFRSVGLTAHPVGDPSIVAGDVLADAVPTVVDGGVFATSACTEQRLKISCHKARIAHSPGTRDHRSPATQGRGQ